MLEKNKIKGILCTLLFLGVVLITGCGERGNSTTQTNQHQDSTSTTSQNDKTDTNPQTQILVSRKKHLFLLWK